MTKVVVAMSGGVDSSVAAALLERAGFDVVGVFMKFWAEPEKDGLVGALNRCCSPEAEVRARKVAKILKIPFYVLNFENEFKKRIVNYFLNGYKKGLTPNPCVVCNKEIKFGLFLKRALFLGADFVATGHYARTNFSEYHLKKSAGAKKFNFKEIKLYRAKDKKKDQSYFLYKLTQKKLRKILFPIGKYTKDEVRVLAKKFKLPILNIPESQEICFIQNTINEFLKKYLKTKPGHIVDARKKILARHQGLWFYTIGQRKGIGLPGGPYFVLDKDLEKNLLTVTKNDKDLLKKELIAKNVNWIAGKPLKFPLKVKAKIRYRHEASPATICYRKPRTRTCGSVRGRSNIYHLKFNRPQRAITPGQSVVFYRGEELLGGGVILKVNS